MPRRAVLGTIVCVLVAAACDGEFRFDDSADGAKIGTGADAGLDATSSQDGGSGPGCKNDGDCKLTSLHCDVPSGQCLACLSDSNCAAPFPRCDAALNRCVACGVDGDCQVDAGQKCDVTSRHCVQTCSSPISDDCPKDEPVCDTSRGQCYRCTSDLECTFSDTDRLCDVNDGLCVGCRVDTDCKSDKPRCDPVSEECVACVDSGDCPASAPLCDPTTLTCVAK